MFTRLGSDYVPLRLEVGSHYSTPRPFRFKLVWFLVEGFQDLVQQWWSEYAPVGCGAFILVKRMARLHEHLRYWAKFSFGSIKLRKLSLLHDLEVLDIIKERRPLFAEEVEKEQDLLDELGTTRKQEELYWR